MTPERETNGHEQPGQPFPWHCPRCRRPAVRPATVPYHAERLHEGRLVTVDVPQLVVPKCDNCGEVVLDRAAEERLIKATAAQAQATDPDPAGPGGGNGCCPITPYHAAYYAHELTRRSASDSIAKIGSSMFNATVDLNPHQLDAALFAFAAPLSRGAILADEVGLGKTIEAALVISQLWAEHKRRILVIAPAILRKQWQQELQEKFFLDSRVIDGREFKAALKAGERPLEPAGRVVIVSHQFAAARAEEVATVPWDLVVIDDYGLLQDDYAGRVLTINGSNADGRSAAIYRAWLQRHEGDDAVTGNKAVDLRAALVEQFHNHADILVATEAAAEGVNFQFCSLVVNYDLPWNPQRIEQRIGRCHRYGQKHDVVVINFLNRGNAADERVFELLSEKFRLFDGVFGSSDEVLGALESGVDFERRVAEIYQACRSREEIDAAFSRLRAELEEQVAARMASTRDQLLEHFDEEVHERLRFRKEESNNYLARAERWLWNVTRHELEGHATFLPRTYAFRLHGLGPGWPAVPEGTYSLVTKARAAESQHAYRLGHPLAQAVLDRARDRPLIIALVRFDYSGYVGKVGAVEGLVGCSGWLTVAKLAVESLEDEDCLLFAAIPDEGPALLPEVYAKLFEVGGEVVARAELPAEDRDRLQVQLSHLEERALKDIADRNRQFFEREIDKLNRWADDRKAGLEFQLKNFDTEIKQTDREARLAPTLEEKLALQKKKKELETQRKEKRRHLYDAEDEIEARKDELIAEVEKRLQSTTRVVELFTIRWEVA